MLSQYEMPAESHASLSSQVETHPSETQVQQLRGESSQDSEPEVCQKLSILVSRTSGSAQVEASILK